MKKIGIISASNEKTEVLPEKMTENRGKTAFGRYDKEARFIGIFDIADGRLPEIMEMI